MAFVIADRVQESTTTIGTGTVSLAGSTGAYRTFVAGIGNTNTTYYAIVHRTTTEWEVGIGTVTDSSPDTLSRDTVLSSSNANALVNFSAGTKDVFCTQPSSRIVTTNNSNRVTIGGVTDINPGLVFLSEQEVTNVATVDFTSLNTSLYSKFTIIINSLQKITGNPDLLIRYSSDAGSSWLSGSFYEWVLNLNNSSGIEEIQSNTTSSTGIKFADTLGNTPDSGGFSGEINFYPATASNFLYHTVVTGGYNRLVGASTWVRCGGAYNAVAAINALQISASSGNITGNFYLYGTIK